MDNLEHCRNAGEIEIPLKQGTLSEDRICGELGDLILGKAAGKSDSKCRLQQWYLAFSFLEKFLQCFQLQD